MTSGHSIARRLLASNLLILVAFLGFAGAVLDRAFRTSTETAIRDQLQAHVYTLLTAAGEDENGRMRLPEALAAPAFNQPDSGLYAEAWGENGAYRWRSASLLGRQGALLENIQAGQIRLRVQQELTLLDQGIIWEDDFGDPLTYSLTVATDRRTVQAQQAAFRETLWQWLGGITFVLLVVQIVVAKWGLAPLHEMSVAVRRIEDGERGRIDGPVPIELQGLSNNLNSLIEQNRLRQERVRNSLADLAHSLKTPLAVLRGAAGQADDPKLAGLIEDQTVRIDDIVSYQRQRAAVAGISSVTRPIALSPILHRLCASLDKVHQERGLSCTLDLAEGIQLRADEGDLFELFGNLLENAYKHCRKEVRVSARMLAGHVQIDIEDDGEGIAERDIQRLLQRGERADQRHPGEGIGLAVVHEIVSQYAGSLRILDSELGGACIGVSLAV